MNRADAPGDGRWPPGERPSVGAVLLWACMLFGLGLLVLAGSQALANDRPSFDGTVVFASSPGKRAPHDLYTIRSNGRGLRRLTVGVDAIASKWSPDGAALAYVDFTGVNAGGKSHLFIARADGSHPREIKGGDGAVAIAWVDRRTPLVVRISGEDSALWQVPATGEPPRRIADFFAIAIAVSPEGTRLAFEAMISAKPPTSRIGVLDLKDGSNKIHERQSAGSHSRVPRLGTGWPHHRVHRSRRTRRA